ncbi:hypothetical protein [Xenorhabdus sp. KK7.4]|uniref:hypothetical protein n=1 Tax=Xenorhabdus sp. KK7.4 TaxID=1851572 RepID=UPI000C04BD35|nr:hypothetical protein [Xenorhabdus sp. KK7.4]PHM51975.1 hypothetical protein Xekk_03403 [Xenorhabdus sp. KK7.4]
MNKIELINYLHSAYPELTIDINYIRGYSEDDLIKLKRVYDIEIQGELLDFLIHMGRCNGGLFGIQPLRFYQEDKVVSHEILFQFGFREELQEIQCVDLLEQKPFFISIENEAIYFYFLLTNSKNPDLVYYLDTNYDTIIDTGLTFNEYLRYIVDTSTRNYSFKVPFEQWGDLLAL